MVSRRERLQKRRASFFLPLVIALGVIVITVIGIRWYINSNDEQVSGNPIAHFSLLSGNARVLLPDGVKYSIEASSEDHTLNVGEGVETVGSTRLEVILQDGSVVRLDNNSAIVIGEYKSMNNKKVVSLTLQKGNMWVNIKNSDAIDTFTVASRISFINFKEGIFAISRNVIEDMYRSLAGAGTVSLLDKDGKSIKTQIVALGQQAKVSDSIVEDVIAGKDVELLSVLDDTFKVSDWYHYNMKRDGTSSGETGSGTLVQSSAIIVSEPAEGSTISEDKVIIRGTAREDVKQVVVNDYVLKQYKQGEGKWQYNAGISYGNLVKGENKFNIYGVLASGEKTEPIIHTFFYGDKPSSGTEENTNQNSSSGETTMSLKAPVITSPNGGKEYTTSESEVVISGTIGSSIEKVVVDDFTLSKFVPGSGTWSYRAYERLGSLIEGRNVFTVYGIDTNGKKTPVAKMVILYKKKTGSGASL